MRGLGLFLPLAAALLAPGAAHARDAAELACPTAGFSAGDAATFASAVAEQAPHTDSRFADFRAALAACRERLGWSEEIADVARMHALGISGAEEMRRRLAASGIDAAPFEREILDDGALIAAGGQGFPEPEMEALLRRVMPRIEALAADHPDIDVPTMMGNFIAFRAIAAAMELRFTAG